LEEIELKMPDKCRKIRAMGPASLLVSYWPTDYLVNVLSSFCE
jgi:hypothetical protein